MSAHGPQSQVRAKLAFALALRLRRPAPPLTPAEVGAHLLQQADHQLDARGP